MSSNQETRYASGTVVFNETGKVLIVTSSKDRTCFVLPKGGVEDGLTTFENAMKEVQEEAGALYMPLDIPAITQERSRNGSPQIEYYFAGLFLSYCEWPEGHIRSRKWIRVEEVADYLPVQQAMIVEQLYARFLIERSKPDFDTSENVMARTNKIGETLRSIREKGYGLQSGIEGDKAPLSEYKQMESRIKRETPRNSGFGQFANNVFQQQLISAQLMHEMLENQIRDLQARGYEVDLSMLGEGCVYIQMPPGYDEKEAAAEVMAVMKGSVTEIGALMNPNEVREAKGGDPFRPSVRVLDYHVGEASERIDGKNPAFAAPYGTEGFKGHGLSPLPEFLREFADPVPPHLQNMELPPIDSEARDKLDASLKAVRGQTPHVVHMDDSPFQNVSGSASVIRSGFEDSAEMKAHSGTDYPRGEAVYHSISDDRYSSGDSGGSTGGCD